MNLAIKKASQEEHGEHRSATAKSDFEKDVVDGLSSTPKTLPCKYFYDTEGSRLFEEICKTPEYYVTRTELSILSDACHVVAKHVGPHADVVEPGSGAGEKVRLLLDALDSPRSFIPIDISKSAVDASAKQLRKQHPDVNVVPVVADFTQSFELPDVFSQRSENRKLIFFPGSTISNFAPSDAQTFLQGLKAVLRSGDFLFIGVDRIKDHQTLEEAYDDAAGVTAAFNLNLLHRITRELPTTLDPNAFSHQAIYNADKRRIEMHLVSQHDHLIELSDSRHSFRKGESIHTENSYKYSVDDFTNLAQASGFVIEEVFSDPQHLFSCYLCRVPE